MLHTDLALNTDTTSGPSDSALLCYRTEQQPRQTLADTAMEVRGVCVVLT